MFNSFQLQTAVMRHTEEHGPLSAHGPRGQKVYGKRRVNLLPITTTRCFAIFRVKKA